MLAQSDVIIKDAAETVYEISQDKLIREQMEAREANIRSEKSLRKHYEDEIGELTASQKAMRKHYEDEIGELTASQKSMRKHYEDEIGELTASQKAMRKHYEDEIVELKKTLADKEATINSLVERLDAIEKKMKQ